MAVGDEKHRDVEAGGKSVADQEQLSGSESLSKESEERTPADEDGEKKESQGSMGDYFV